MKNTEKNKKKWVEKVRYTLELGGKSDRTFSNYKSHINRFLNYYDETTEINKLWRAYSHIWRLFTLYQQTASRFHL